MPKAPPCSQYTPKHALMRSKLGLEYCRKVRESAKNNAGPSRLSKPPPCTQYKPKHSLIVSKFGVQYCRKVKHSAKNTAAGSSTKNKIRKAKPPVESASLPKMSQNNKNIKMLRRLTRNIRPARLNRMGAITL